MTINTGGNNVYYTGGIRFREGGLLLRDAGLIFACKRPYLDGIYTKSGATVYSLIETAKANDVEPYAYLALVLTDMQYMGKPFSNETLESLMPWSNEMKQSINSRTKPTSSSDE